MPTMYRAWNPRMVYRTSENTSRSSGRQLRFTFQMMMQASSVLKPAQSRIPDLLPWTVLRMSQLRRLQRMKLSQNTIQGLEGACGMDCRKEEDSPDSTMCSDPASMTPAVYRTSRKLSAVMA